MDDKEIEKIERELISIIQLIRREYEEHLKPYYDQLAKIRALRPPPPIFITKEQLKNED